MIVAMTIQFAIAITVWAKPVASDSLQFGSAVLWSPASMKMILSLIVIDKQSLLFFKSLVVFSTYRRDRALHSKSRTGKYCDHRESTSG